MNKNWTLHLEGYGPIGENDKSADRTVEGFIDLLTKQGQNVHTGRFSVVESTKELDRAPAGTR